MKFVNLTQKDLAFEIHGKHYSVPVGGECEVPDRVAYCVKLHGLPLTPAADVEPAPKPVAVPEPEPMPGPVKDEPQAAPVRKGRWSK